MRSLGHLLHAKEEQTPTDTAAPKKMTVDAKTVFFLFTRLVRQYYGERGGKAIYPFRYESGVLTIKVASPLWANELTLGKKELCARLNQEIGEVLIVDIHVLHGLRGAED